MKSWMLALWFLVPLAITVQEKRTREGNERYEEGKFDEAIQAYTQAQVEHPDASELHFNIGNAHFKNEDMEKAGEEYQAVVNSRPVQDSGGGEPEHEAATDRLVSSAHFNSGNIEYLGEQYDAAAKAYSESLRIDPSDLDARQNLELALQKLQQQQEDSQESENEESEQGGGSGSGDGESGEDQEEEQQEEQPQDQQQDQEQQQDQQQQQQQDSPEQAPQEQSEGGQAEEMTQEEAQQILQALAQMEQAELQRQQDERRSRKRGKGKIW